MFFKGSGFLFVTFICFFGISKGLSLKELRNNLSPSTSKSVPENGFHKELTPTGIVLERDIRLECCPKGQNREYPEIYCYNAVPKSLGNLWCTAQVLISLNPEQYELYWGQDEAEVVDHFISEQTFLKFNLFFWKQKDIKLNPFNSTCFGIQTTHDYNIELQVEKFNNLRQSLWVSAVAIFYIADLLAKDKLFFYLTGIIGGVFLSFAVLAYFVLALMPAKRTTIAAMIAGGSGMAYLAMDWIVVMVRTLIIKYQTFVFGYIVVSAIISFFACYRYGPVTNPRSINIIKWSLQGASTIAMWSSSYYQGAMLTIIGLMVLFYYVPVFSISWKMLCLILFRPIWFLVVNFHILSNHIMVDWIWRYVKKLYFTIKYKLGFCAPRLLTHFEYRMQGLEETRRGLTELQETFLNHEINAYEMLYRLSPQSRERFLLFLTNREDHILPDEEEEHHGNYLTDDEY